MIYWTNPLAFTRQKIDNWHTTDKQLTLWYVQNIVSQNVKTTFVYYMLYFVRRIRFSLKKEKLYRIILNSVVFL